MRLYVADVAKRVLSTDRRYHVRTRSALDSLAVDIEADMTGENLEALLLGRMEVGWDVAARIGKDLGMQDVALAGERETLAADRIMDELGHGDSFCLGPVI